MIASFNMLPISILDGRKVMSLEYPGLYLTHPYLIWGARRVVLLFLIRIW